MRPSLSLACALLVGALIGSLMGIGPAQADQDDATLRLLLKPAELVVAGTVLEGGDWWSSEAGVMHGRVTMQVKDVLKGTWDKKQKLVTGITRFGFAQPGEVPQLKKGADVILFLKKQAEGAVPRWRTSNYWIAVQPYNKMMAVAIKRMVKPAR